MLVGHATEFLINNLSTVPDIISECSRQCSLVKRGNAWSPKAMMIFLLKGVIVEFSIGFKNMQLNFTLSQRKNEVGPIIENHFCQTAAGSLYDLMKQCCESRIVKLVQSGRRSGIASRARMGVSILHRTLGGKRDIRSTKGGSLHPKTC